MNCSICNNHARVLIDKKDRFGRGFGYVICENCHFICEKGLILDPLHLQKKVGALYEDDYFDKTDTGWQVRGDGFLKIIKKIIKVYSLFKNQKNIKILDYGAGNGYITSKLAEDFNVFYYDRYEKPTVPGNYTILDKPQKANIIYAVELVEHITDIKEWDFLRDLTPSIFIFTTGLSDNIRDEGIKDWSYLNPDAGHIALYSHRSLYLLGKKYGFIYFFFPNISCHVFLKNKFLSKVNVVALEYFIYSFFRKIKNKFLK